MNAKVRKFEMREILLTILDYHRHNSYVIIYSYS